MATETRRNEMLTPEELGVLAAQRQAANTRRFDRDPRVREARKRYQEAIKAAGISERTAWQIADAIYEIVRNEMANR